MVAHTPPMIIDVFTYNGEIDILELHLNILYKKIDQFVIIEFDKTFSGEPKGSFFEKQKGRLQRFQNKLIYYYITDDSYTNYNSLALLSPQTNGAEHWKREFCQKESIKDIVECNPDDLVIIGDVDEILDPRSLHSLMPFTKIKLDVYTYYLNNRSNENFWGPIILPGWALKNITLNHFRQLCPPTQYTYGWHFTSMGGYEEVKRKLSNSYTKDSYWTEAVESSLQNNLAQLKDFLGRDFTYTKDESNWPSFLKEHKDQYKRLCL